MDVHVRALYHDLIISYIEYLIPNFRLNSEFEVMLSLLPDESLETLLNVLRSVTRTLKDSTSRRAGHAMGKSN